MSENTIKVALKKGERVMLECKKATAEVLKSLWETYSAFANTIGGLILLGVDEHRNEIDLAKRLGKKPIGERLDYLTNLMLTKWNWCCHWEVVE